MKSTQEGDEDIKDAPDSAEGGASSAPLQAANWSVASTLSLEAAAASGDCGGECGGHAIDAL